MPQDRMMLARQDTREALRSGFAEWPRLRDRVDAACGNECQP